MKPWVRAVLVIVVFQAAALIVYEQGDRSAVPEGFPIATLTTRATAPAWTLEDRAGAVASDGSGRWRVVHFWATWCPPCRRELPGVLALARTGTIVVLPVAVDPSWTEIDRFFEGQVPPEIVRLRTPETLARFGASVLPDSYVLAPDGTIVARIAGERDWTTAEARRALEAMTRSLAGARP